MSVLIPTLRSYVAGQWIGEGELVDDVNPARPDEVVARSAHADSTLALRAIAAAVEAAPRWRQTPAPVRGAILHRTAQLLEDRAREIGRDIAREEGKTAAEGVGETLRASAIFRYYAGQTLEPDGETYPSHSAETFLYARREPVGPVTVITPWNFPIAIPAWKIAPALAYGNPVCWKPAELVPLTSVRLTEALIEAGLPDGVLSLLLGRGADIGEALVSSPGVAAVSFTGSNAVGRSIQRAARDGGAKVQLELGGKNPAVVLADADLDLAAEQLARGAFLSAGQKCTATSRILVEQPVFEELVERLSDRARSWQLGDPLDPETRVGPVASQSQFDTVASYLELARAEGCSFAAGGSTAEHEGGWYIQPSVITGLVRTSRVMTEEIFGPVAALTQVDDLDQAIFEANDTAFGLTAALFTSNLHHAFRFADEVRAGVVKVNQESAGLEFHVPFGGTKASSSGSREQGKAAREFFTEWKTVYIDAPG